jgi:hypothetical protein
MKYLDLSEFHLVPEPGKPYFVFDPKGHEEYVRLAELLHNEH